MAGDVIEWFRSWQPDQGFVRKEPDFRGGGGIIFGPLNLIAA